MSRLVDAVVAAWYRPSVSWTALLWPLSLIVAQVAKRRRRKSSTLERWPSPVPIVVVGNITVGGTGKTPVVASLATALQEAGLRPGIISRGYGGSGETQWVRADSDPKQVGDEPVMLARQTGVPLVVDRQRARAAQTLVASEKVDVILCDDGLQHFQLDRHIELVVVDGERWLGNGLCLPAGPLREPAVVLDSVNAILVNINQSDVADKIAQTQQRLNGRTVVPFQLTPGALTPLIGNNRATPQGTVHAVAGIGNPQRFFTTLRSLGFEVIEHPFADHHPFSAADLAFDDELPVVMTAKDAVKCRHFASERHWFLPVSSTFPDGWLTQLIEQIKTVDVRGSNG